MTVSPRAAGPLLLALLLASAGCSPKPTTIDPADEADGPAWFEDVTDAVGLDFVHDPGPTDAYFMPQSMGSGTAFLHDSDGTLYLYLIQDAGPDSKSVNRLYRREKDGKFKDVTEGSGLGVAGYGMGVAVGDVNNDGRPDVLLTEYGRIRLFLNLGGGKFEDVTAEAGLSDPLWAMSAAFFDYDRDGLLDLVVVNYLDYDPKRDCLSPEGKKDYCGPNMFSGTCSKLFHNVTKPGGRPRFEDVSFASGIGRLPGPGLGVACADFDGDGWPDIFVSDDGQPNRLWINQHDGTFKDEAASRGVALTSMGKAFAGMGIAVGDTGGSGLLDLYVAHLGSETNTLWKQGPRGRFRDRTVDSGLTTGRWRGTGFGALLADFTLDGALDVAVVNGRTVRGGSAHDPGLGFWETYAERNQLFANDGASKFHDISPSNKAFCGYWNVGRGLACDDYDGDGAPDLLATSIGGKARLFHNVAPNRGHWLQVRAFDPKHHRDAYGAEVRVRAGGREQLRLVNPAQSYLCSNSPLALFGLGQATKVDSVVVSWPDGKRQEFDGGPVDQVMEIAEREDPRHDASATRPEAAAPEAVTPAEPAHHSPLSQARQRLQLLYREAFRAPSLRSVWNGMKTAREAAPRPSYGV